MEKIVHEMGHAWLFWSHSYAELMSVPYAGHEPDLPNPYSNRFDFMTETGVLMHVRCVLRTLIGVTDHDVTRTSGDDLSQGIDNQLG